MTRLTRLYDWSFGATQVALALTAVSTALALTIDGEWHGRLVNIACYSVGALMQALNYHGRIDRARNERT